MTGACKRYITTPERQARSSKEWSDPRILFSRWLLSFVGTALMAVLVWFFGPLLSLLESWVPSGW